MGLLSKITKSIKNSISNSIVAKGVKNIVADVNVVLHNDTFVQSTALIKEEIHSIGDHITDAANALFKDKSALKTASQEIDKDLHSIQNNVQSIVTNQGIKDAVQKTSSDIAAVAGAAVNIEVGKNIIVDTVKLAADATVQKFAQDIGKNASQIATNVGVITAGASSAFAGNLTSIASVIGSGIRIGTEVKNILQDVDGITKTETFGGIFTDIVNDTLQKVKATGAVNDATAINMSNYTRTVDNSIIGATYGTSGNDYVISTLGVAKDITTGTGDDVVVGGIGNFTIDGGVGNDILIGGFGSDTIKGGSGNNILWGGIGEANDTLIGGDNASNTYLWGKHDGNDTIISSGKSDLVVLYNSGKEALNLSLQGNDLVIGSDAANSLTIKDWQTSSNRVNDFAFAADPGAHYTVSQTNGKVTWTLA